MIDVAGYEVAVIRKIEDLDHFLPEWEEFLRKVGSYHYCQEPALFRNFCASTAPNMPLVIVVRQSGNIQCVAPFVVSRNSLPIRFSVIRLFSLPMRQLLLMGDGLVCSSDANEQECIRCALHQLLKCRDSFHVLDLEHLPESESLWRNLAAVLPKSQFQLLYATPGRVSHAIAIADKNHEGYLRNLKSRDRTNLQRRKRKLWEHAGDDVRLVKVTGCDQISFYLQALDQISLHTWQSRVFGKGDFKSAELVSFFNLLAERGWLRSYVLLCRGEPVAFQMGIHHGDTFYFVETGYDSRWANFGPGTVLECLVIEDLFRECPPRQGDFGFGDAEYKRILGNSTHVEMEHVYLARRWSIYPRLVFWLMAFLEWNESWIANVLRRSRIDGTARRLLKGNKIAEKSPASP